MSDIIVAGWWQYCKQALSLCFAFYKLKLAQLLANIFGYSLNGLVSVYSQNFSTAVPIELQERLGFGLESYKPLLYSSRVVVRTATCERPVEQSFLHDFNGAVEIKQRVDVNSVGHDVVPGFDIFNPSWEPFVNQIITIDEVVAGPSFVHDFILHQLNERRAWDEFTFFDELFD